MVEKKEVGKDDFRDTVGLLGKLIDEGNPDLTQFFSGRIEEVKSTIGVMKNDIMQAFEDEKKVNISGENVRDVQRILNMILRNMHVKRETETTKCFVENYLIVASNWKQLFNNPDFKNTINAIQVKRDFTNSTIALVRMINDILPELKSFREFKPEAFKMSRHYLKSLRDEIDN